MKTTNSLWVFAAVVCLIGQRCMSSAVGTGLVTNEEAEKRMEMQSDLASSASDNLHRMAYSIPDTEPEVLRAQPSGMKEIIAQKVAETFKQRKPFRDAEKLRPEPSTNIRCVAESGDTPKASDTKEAPVAKPVESPKYERAVSVSSGKESTPTLSLLPIRLSFTNLPDLSFLKRAPLSEVTGTTVAASEQHKTQQNKARIVLPDNLFIPLDIGLAIGNMGVSVQKTAKMNAEPQKNVYSYKQTQSNQPKSYSHPKPSKYVSKKNSEKQGYRPYSKYYDYPKYPAKSYGPKSYSAPYSNKYSESPDDRHYQNPPPPPKTYSSESRPNYEKTKVDDDEKGCRTVIKEIQEVPHRSKRGANEPRVIIMTKECFHPDNAASVKIPEVKYGSYSNSYYPESRSTARPGVRHYESTQNKPSYAYQNAYPYQTKYEGYYKDPYQYDGSSVYPHGQYYGNYPSFYYPYGQRRSSDNRDEVEGASSDYDRPSIRESSRSKHEEEEEYKERPENHKAATEDRRSSTHFHPEDRERAKPTPKTVNRSFAYYRKDNDDGKDPHNHEENEEYAQGNYRSYSTSYDSDRDGPK